MSTLGLDLGPNEPVGERTPLHLRPTAVALDLQRFSHSDAPRHTGHRGTRVVAPTPHDGRILSAHAPDVYVSGNGAVEIGDASLTAGFAVLWLRAVADHIEARTPAPTSTPGEPVRA